MKRQVKKHLFTDKKWIISIKKAYFSGSKEGYNFATETGLTQVKSHETASFNNVESRYMTAHVPTCN